MACIPNLQTYVDYNGVQFLGDGTLAGTTIRKMAADETLDLNAKGVFIVVGLEPNRGRGQGRPGGPALSIEYAEGGVRLDC